MKKIFIGPCEIAGYYSNLMKGFSNIGLDAKFHTYQNHPFGYGGESKPTILLAIIKFLSTKQQECNLLTIKIPIFIVSELTKFLFFIDVIRKYDVLIFGFGQTLTRFTRFELFIYKVFDKKIIFNIMHGSESRPPYIDGTHQSKDGTLVPTSKAYRAITRKIKKNNRNISDYADVIVGAPYSTSQFIRKKYINHFSIGLPIYNKALFIDTFEKKYSIEDRSNKKVRILHSPSHPAVKGTSLIIDAINNLKDKGYNIDFILLQNKPNSEVIEEIKKCDFIVDQLYSDTPLATFATEAAWFGKPAIVGGYGLESLKNYVKEDMWPPSKICYPDDIEKNIEELIVDTEQRKILGEKAKIFVREKWSINEVALKYKKIIEGNIPSEWMIDPKEIIYLEGVGQSSELTKRIVNRMIVNYGIDSLQLKDRSDLEHAYIEFISKD